MYVAPASNGKVEAESRWVECFVHELYFSEGDLIAPDCTLDASILMQLPCDVGSVENPLPASIAGIQNPPDKKSLPEGE